jgi:hypothetical protein
MTKKKIVPGMPLALLALVFLLAGCVTRLGDFTLLASRNVEYSRMGEFKISQDRVTGKDGLMFILGIKVKRQIDLEQALENAIDKIPGCVALADVTLSLRELNFLLWQTHTYVVTGNAIIDPRRLSASEHTPDSPYISLYTEDGLNYETRYLTGEEYSRYLSSLAK